MNVGALAAAEGDVIRPRHYVVASFEALEQPSRSLDIAEEERDRAGRKRHDRTRSSRPASARRNGGQARPMQTLLHTGTTRTGGASLTDGAPATAGDSCHGPHRAHRCGLAAGRAARGSANIAALQVALRAQRLYAGSVDGVDGPGTAGAVAVFSGAQAWTPTGSPAP